MVDTPEKADAVLTASIKTGSKNVDQPVGAFGDPAWRIGSTVVTTQEITFRLDSRQNQTLWAAKFDPGSFSNMSESKAAHALASKVSRTFQKAVARDSVKR